MPGLVGCLNTKQMFTAEEILQARDAMKYYDWYRDDSLFEDANLLATRTHLNILGEADSPFCRENCYCWVEGEAYNLDEIAAILSVSDKTERLSQVLIQAYLEQRLETVLAKINGHFTAVLYDADRMQLKLISDRLGIKPLYIWNDSPYFAWASELKALLSFKAFVPVIRKDALSCFMANGFMMGETTWFKSVKLLPPATVLTMDIKSQTVSNSRYWTWSRIVPLQLSFEEAVDETVAVLKKTLACHSHLPARQIGVGLSGGLDSRILLAAANEAGLVPCYTFGQTDALDIEIARQAAEVKGNSHTIFELSAENWLENRFESVWKTDGMKSLLHMHYSRFHRDIKTLMDVNLNGFAGDATLGGVFLNGHARNERITQTVAAQWFGKSAALDNPMDDYFSINRLDPYIINNRVRRHVNLGTVDVAKTIEQRHPLVDNRIIELMYALPEEYRLYSRLYNNALLRLFPDYFETIPWQTSGKPIERHVPFRTRIKKRIQNTIKHSGFYTEFKTWVYRSGMVKRTRDFADYERWISHPETSRLFQRLLDPSHAVYAQFTPDNYLEKYLKPHLRCEKNYAEQIGRAVTTEIWLSHALQK